MTRHESELNSDIETEQADAEGLLVDKETEKKIARLKKRRDKIQGFLSKNSSNKTNQETLKNILEKLAELEKPVQKESEEQPEEEIVTEPIAEDHPQEAEAAESGNKNGNIVTAEEETVKSDRGDSGPSSGSEAEDSEIDKVKIILAQRTDGGWALINEETKDEIKDESLINQEVDRLKQEMEELEETQSKLPQEFELKTKPEKENLKAEKLRIRKEIILKSTQARSLLETDEDRQKQREALDEALKAYQQSQGKSHKKKKIIAKGGNAKINEDEEEMTREEDAVNRQRVEEINRQQEEDKNMTSQHKVKNETETHDQGETMTLEEIESLREKATAELLEMTKGLKDEDVDKLADTNEDYKKIKDIYDALGVYWDKKREGKEELTPDDQESIKNIQSELDEYLNKKTQPKPKAKAKPFNNVPPDNKGKPKGATTMETKPKGEPRVETEQREAEPITHEDESLGGIQREIRETRNATVTRWEKAAEVTYELDTDTMKGIEKNLMAEIDERRAELIRDHIAETADDADKSRLMELSGKYALEEAQKLGGFDQREMSDERMVQLHTLLKDLKGGSSTNNSYNSLVSLDSRRLMLDILNKRKDKFDEEASEANAKGDIATRNKKNSEVEELFKLRNKLAEKINGKNFEKRVLGSESMTQEQKEHVNKKVREKINNTEAGYESSFELKNGNYELKDKDLILPDDALKPGQKPEEKKNDFRDFISEYINDKNLNVKNAYTLASIKKAGYKIEKEYHATGATKYIPLLKRLNMAEKSILVKGDQKIDINFLNEAQRIAKLNEIKGEAEKLWGGEVSTQAAQEWMKNAKENMMESLAEKDESTIEAQYKAIRKEIYDKEIMSKLGKTEKTREDLAKLKENFEKDPKSIKNALEEAMENKKKIHSDSLDDEENINAINDTLESWGLSKMKSEQIKEFNGRNPMKFGKAAKNNKNWIGWLLELAFRPAPAKGKSKK